jgi:site-specific DNA-methyltransferase (adenine-specific)
MESVQATDATITNWTHYLMQGECLERMKEIPDGYVDMILCDLPYGTTACKWDTVIDLPSLWAAYKRICKPTAAIVLTASQPFTSMLGASNLKMLKYSWVWEKARPTNFLQAKRRPMKGFEDVVVFYASSPVYNPQGITAVNRIVKNTGTKARGRQGTKLNDDHSYHGTVTGADENDMYSQKITGYPRGIVKFAQDSEALHPTQKPVALMEYMIKTYTDEGMIVLDNCMGSGTTGVACINTQRKFIGIEQDANYFAIAKQRIEDAIVKHQTD